MVTLVFGDIHGRTIWKDIVKKEKYDKVIFLGDYVTTHELISDEQQLSNFVDTILPLISTNLSSNFRLFIQYLDILCSFFIHI